MKNLNENETKAMRAICADCDEIDGWGFTRIGHMVAALMDEFDNNGQRVGGYIATLLDKNLIDVCAEDNEVWVKPETFEAYC